MTRKLESQPFYLSNGRAMVSLGPLSGTRHCPFRCPFCYVESPDFVRYESWAVEKTISWLKANLEQIKVIYVSGDTDSFAPPRTSAGLAFLRALADLNRDLLFTTRHVFTNEDEWQQLKTIAERVRASNKIPIGCISVCQISRPEFEPPPIAPAVDRIAQLAKLRSVGWVPVLAMRPILPSVPREDFERILTLASPHTRYCLVSEYYFDPKSPQWQPPVEKAKPVGGLYFDIGSSSEWFRVEPERAVLDAITNSSNRLRIRVFDRSDPLYETIRREEGATN